MKKSQRFKVFLVFLIVILYACGNGGETPTPTIMATLPPVATAEPTAAEKVEDPIYLSIIWHQHQPVYFKDPETETYTRPWVRVHATKDYVDMAAILEGYPDIHVTFNLTPSLIRQLDDLESGTKDLYWVLAEVPASDLTDEQKIFILDRFFDTNRRVIARFPRYQELLNLRDASDNYLAAYETQDYLDLQIMFNLAWVDPDWLAQEPLAGLVAKGRDYDESDKAILFAEHERLIGEVIPVHKALQDSGQIEITMTPFAHPILPLLVNTDLARIALSDLVLPGARFAFGQDAVAQVELGVQLYEDHFGMAPRGMWPAEGSVAQEIVTMVARNGIQWMASDEGVLANSLGFDSFTRNANETVVDADTLYRPYYVEGRQGGPVAMVFRDVVISDKVGFTYSGMDGDLAAADFINRIHDIREQLIASGAEGPHLVSVILDGENAWEYYENDGKEFLHSLYQGLSEDSTIITVTPSEFLEIAPQQPAIEQLWAGSWISHDFSTWIGEDEENRAWELLTETRILLQEYITGSRAGTVSEEQLEEAMLNMYIAEGSDWFWWYGADQDSGNDESFDEMFRNTLKQVYVALGLDPPTILDVPIIPQRAVGADTPSTDLVAVEIDGVASPGEWDAGGTYLASGGAMAAGQPFFASLTYGFDSKNLNVYIEKDAAFTYSSGESVVEIYLAIPGGRGVNNFTRSGTLLGFGGEALVTLNIEDGQFTGAAYYLAEGDERWSLVADSGLEAAVGEGIEFRLSFTDLGNADTGDRISFRAFYQETQTIAGVDADVDVDSLPGMGPAQLAVPDVGTTTVLLEIDDPASDDYGPGTYTYPSDSVFSGGNFDILNFQMGEDDENIVFKIVMRGPVDNPWGSPNGLSLQTIDIYIDADQDGVGGKALLPGRNLTLLDPFAWDFAIHAEGWTAGIYTPGVEGPNQIATSSEFQILVDPGQRKITIRVPKALLGDNPADWAFAVMSLSQEGYPSGGVMRVRDVLPVGEQWRLGGAPPGATNHTRVVDIVWAEQGMQEAWLSDFTPVSVAQAELTAENFAAVFMFTVESRAANVTLRGLDSLPVALPSRRDHLDI